MREEERREEDETRGNVKGTRGSWGMVTGEGAVEELGEDEKCFFLSREGA